MNFRDIFQLEDSTVQTGQRIYNLLVRTLMFALAIVGFAGLAVGLNFLLPVVASLLGLGDETLTLLRAGAAIFFVILVVATLLYSIGDVLTLVWYYLRHGEGENGQD